MDMGYMSELLTSVMIFAPGVVLLSICLFVGVLVLLEKAGVFGAMAEETPELETTSAAAQANPPAGDVIAGLETAIAQEAGQDEASESKAVNGN